MSSVSKGCFAFKNKRKKKLRAENYFLNEDGQTTEDSKVRHQTFMSSWQDIEQEIESIQSELNSIVFEELLEYVRSVRSNFSLEDSSEGAGALVCEVPTAAVVTGVNIPDHSAMFGNLLSLIRDKVTPYVGVLHSRHCSNMKALMAKLVSQFMGLEKEDGEEADDENILKRSFPCTLPMLCGWYQDITQKPNKKTLKEVSGKKRKLLAYPQFPPLLILIEDFENFQPHILQDFIAICHQYIGQLPVVLVFGIATSVTVIHRHLPHSTSSLLSIEKFQAQSSSQHLSLVIDRVLLNSQFAFKFGYKAFQLLLDIFLCHDFSVGNFVKGLKFAMLDHYQSNPLSCLCCAPEETVGRVRNLGLQQLELYRQTDCFRRYVEQQKPQEQKVLLLDNKHFKKLILKWMMDIQAYHQKFYPMLLCLHSLTGSLPGHPLGKHPRELYSLCLQSNVSESEAYREAFSLVRLLARDELASRLKRCVDLLTSSEDGRQHFEDEGVITQLNQLAAQLQFFGDPQAQSGSDSESSADGAAESLPLHSPQSCKTLYDLQMSLRGGSSGHQQQFKRSKRALAQDKAVDYLEAMFADCLCPPQSLPLYEVHYYLAAAKLRRHLNSSPRAAIQTALSNPHYYLQCACCGDESEGIVRTAPDVCIAYRLHLESGTIINLYDWFQAFATIVMSIQSRESQSSSNQSQEEEKVLYARFIRAVAELQFLGFIKSTKKKTDHVARLTWGGC